MSNKHYALGISELVDRREIDVRLVKYLDEREEILDQDDLEDVTDYQQVTLYLEKARQHLTQLKEQNRFTGEHQAAIIKIEEAIDKLYHWDRRLFEHQISKAPIPTSYGDILNKIYQLDNYKRMGNITINLWEDDPRKYHYYGGKYSIIGYGNDLKLPISSHVFFTLSACQSILKSLVVQGQIQSPNKEVHWWVDKDIDKLEEGGNFEFNLSMPWVTNDLGTDTLGDCLKKAINQYPETLHYLNRHLEANPQPNFIDEFPEDKICFYINSVMSVSDELLAEETGNTTLPQEKDEKAQEDYFLKQRHEYEILHPDAVILLRDVKYRHPLFSSKIPEWVREYSEGEVLLTGSALSPSEYFGILSSQQADILRVHLNSKISAYLDEIKAKQQSVLQQS